MSATLSRREVAAARRRRLFFEPLEERSLLAAVITVNSTLDTDVRDSALTLREAILINNRTLAVGSLTAAEQAQVVGAPTSGDRDTIGFNIAGSGVRTISPGSNLPSITDSVNIDGYSQPGAVQNSDPNGFNGTLLIELKASASLAAGLQLRTSNSLVSGLVINGVVNGDGISIEDGSNNIIQGNFLGTDAAGITISPNRWGVDILALSSVVSNNVIGGSDPAARNLISGNEFAGIRINSFGDNSSVQGTLIQGNFIGTNATGTSALGNGAGIAVFGRSAGTTIGGSGAGTGNLISGNRSGGIDLGGTQLSCSGSFQSSGAGTMGSIVQGNKIGTDVTGRQALGNGTNGISVGFQLVSTSVIGGPAPGEGNIIAFNGLHGVGILSSQTEILSNSIFSNAQLGIHLGLLGCTARPNDSGDADGGPNSLQNFPVVSAAAFSGGNLTVNYAVPSTTGNSAYPLRVEFFKADSAGQEGQVFVGADTYLAAEASATKTFSFVASAAFSAGEKLVATATDSNGNTSEFSADVVVQTNPCLTVSNTLDSGAGSLRAAISCANSLPNVDGPDAGSEPDPDVITFAIPGAGVKTISPGTALPTITDPVVIDGYTQPGASPNTSAFGESLNTVLLIELDGENATGDANGITISAGGSTIRGLVINDFDGDGIVLSPGGGNTVVGNFIGTDVTGVVPAGNGGGTRVGVGNGIAIGGGLGSTTTSDDNRIGGLTPAERNVISFNQLDGIQIRGSRNSIQGNFIGPNATGGIIGDEEFGTNRGNRIAGIEIDAGANNMIGGTAPNAGNIIGGNNSGIQDLTDGNVFQGNFIGVTPSGGKIGNSIAMAIRSDTLVGGTVPGAANTIGDNGSGLFISGTGNIVQGNFIGTNLAGEVLGNRSVGISMTRSNNLIGGTAPGSGNVIANQGNAAVRIESVFATMPLNNAVLGNRIFDNGFGIDLDNDGVTPNDADDADAGVNNRQNFPVLGTAIESGGTLRVQYEVPSSTSNSAYPLRVEFFKADRNGRQGQTYLGSDTYLTNEAGMAKTAELASQAGLVAGDRIVATATDSANNTSEFSASVEFESCFIVSNTLDSGPGSLRAAISCANSTPNVDGPDAGSEPDPDVITFAIPGAGVKTISVTTQLPTLTDAAIIDGYTQPGSSANTNAIDDPDPTKRGFNGTLLIELTNGAGVSDGLILPSGSTVRGLVVNRFQHDGITVGSDCVIEGNLIGTDATGSLDRGNQGVGVTVNGVNSRVGGTSPAARNVVSGNHSGIGVISFSGAQGNVVAGNFVGTDATGTRALGNESIGIFTYQVGSTLIGGTQSGARNVISGNSAAGIHLVSSREVTVAGNYVGVDVTGTQPLGNGTGVVVEGFSENVIGGTTAEARNIISANVTGVYVAFRETVVQGNYIGTDATGLLPLGNSGDGIAVTSGFARNNLIGGNEAGAGNRIAFNGGSGVHLFTDSSGNNAILGNAIYGNGALGIDIKGDFNVVDGVTANDAGDADQGPNNVQNFPQLQSAMLSGSELTVQYVVPSSVTNSSYALHVEFFRADVDGQEGQTFLGADTYTAAEAGLVKTVAFTPAIALGVGNRLVATATDSNGNTSEFSPDLTLEGPNVPPVLGSINGSNMLTASEATVPLATAPSTNVQLSASDPDSAQTLAFSLAVDPFSPPGCTAYDASNPAHANLLQISIPTQTQMPGEPPSGSSSATGTLRVKAGPNAAGTWCFLVRVTDGIASDEHEVTLTVNRTNSSPQITSNGGGETASISVQENNTAVTDVDATELDAEQTLTFSIVGGADADKFMIQAGSGTLTFVSAPDFENPTDVGSNRVYDLVVRASDGNLIDDQTIAVTVTNANEAPSITTNGSGPTASISVAENSTAVTDVDATDPDGSATLTYSKVGGADTARFSINSSTGVLTFISAPNFESPTDAGANNVYEVIVRVSDGSLSDTQTISVTVTGVNEPPTIVSNGGGATANISLAENTQTVTDVNAADPDASPTLTYTISGTDAASFTIMATTGLLTFATTPDFENPTDADGNNVYNVTVQVSDGSLADTQAITVTVTNTSASCSTVVSNTNNSGTGSLRAAITCANTNDVPDVIVVPVGQYTLSGAANEDANVGGDLDLREGNHSITIRGSGAEQTIITAGGSDRVIHVLPNVPAVIENLTVTGGSTTNGGGILNAGILTLNDVTVRNNTAVTGGGISNTGQLSLHRGHVHDNLATSTSTSLLQGGGIFASLGTTVSPAVIIADSTIENNSITSSAGPTVSVTAEGGAISSNSVPISVVRSIIRGNSVSNIASAATVIALGGGIHITGATASITSSEIRNNQLSVSTAGGDFALTDGGGIYSSSGSLTIDQSLVVENAILNSSATTGVINVLGGGLFFATGLTPNQLTIRDSDFSRNTIESTTTTGTTNFAAGGGIYATGGTIEIARTTIQANRVTGGRNGSAGGMNLTAATGASNAATATLTNVAISQNIVEAPTSPSGGGLTVSTNVSATLSNSTIDGNRIDGPGFGGGLSVTGNQMTVIGSTISRNAIESPTSGNGGGIRSISPLTLINSTVSGNTVTGASGFTSSDGGISTADDPVLIRNSTITGNRVVNGTTGGLDANPVSGTSFVTMHNSIVAGNFAGSAGTTPSDIVGTVNVGTVQSPSSFNNLVGDSASSGGLMNGVNGNKVGNNGSGTININTVLNATLANNGGPTLTHALVAGSPAINSGSNAQAVDVQNQPLTTDQRGAGFPRIVSVVDIGAFESAAVGCSLIVVNTLDSGLGSLREAINCANITPNINRDANPGVDPDRITFAIPGAGVKTIAPGSALPAITEAVIIDGYSQPGASGNTKGPGQGGDAVLLVELNGANAGASATGLQLSGANDSIIKGLVINRFAQGGIQISNGNRNTIAGNYIGTDPTGTMALANKNFGVTVSASMLSGPSSDNIIGGTSAAARNLISGNRSFVAGSFYPGILLAGSASGEPVITGTIIQGNFIGTDVTGTSALPNSTGIHVSSQTSDTIIGGPAVGEGNLISGNQFDGIGLGAHQNDCGSGSGSFADSAGNVIQGNRIGTDITGTQPLGNGSNGIVVGFQPNSSHAIGGTGPGEGNIVGFNGLHGIALFNSHTAILSNSIFSNSLLGINLNFACSVTPNDPDDTDSGPNNQQNFPEIATASFEGGNLTVDYAVPSSTADSAYPLRVEFFKADSAGEEGRVFVGADTYLAAEASATKSIAFAPAVGFSLGNKLVATATDSNGNTSEFSTGIAVQAISCLVVTNTLDSGLGSLREAIDCANSSPNEDGPDAGNEPDADVIRFAIPGGGVKTIAPSSALPAITEAVVIDGYTQSGASANTLAVGNNAVLMVELNGLSAGAGSNGLTIEGSGSTVKGLVINRFAANGILLQGGGFHTIAGNFIGTNAAGSAALGNGATGVRVLNSINNVIGGLAAGARNVVSGNLDSGVYVVGPTSSGNTIAGNYVGVSASGATALGNSTDGVVVQSPSNVIGGTQAGEGNVISGNSRAGVVLFSGAVDNMVAGNLIGVNAAGTAAVGNQAEGIVIHGGAESNLIGVSAANVVSGNVLDGIVLLGSATRNDIAGNFIGTNLGGTAAIPNGSNGIRVAGGTNNSIRNGNTMAHNGGAGVAVLVEAAAGNSIVGNSIHDNAGQGIDLAGDGLTSNDLSDADTGPNGLQNFPVITSVSTAGGNTIISGRLESTPNSPFRLEFFASDLDPIGLGEGQSFLGTIDVTTNAIGRVFFTASVAGVVPAGRVVTATATTQIDDDGNPNSALVLADTSEFSVAMCSLIVTTNADSGVGSLREAIACANVVSNIDRDGLAGTDPDPITFAIPGSGVQTITLGSSLPEITEAVTIDGYTQPGASANTQVEGNDAVLLVEINATAAGAGTGVLHITGGSSTVRGLVINRSPGAAIVVPPATGASNRFDGNFLGTNAAGDQALPNGGGIFVATPSNVIGGELSRERNVIVTTGDAVRISSGQVVSLGTVVKGNYLGTNAAGTAALPSGSMGTNGVSIAGAANNTIGGASAGARNVIANFGVGVNIFGDAASVNTVQGNYIGTDAAGIAALPNGIGIQISQAAGQGRNSGNLIGGAVAGEGNVVSGNGAGIVVHSDFNTIQGNFIGVDFGGFAPLGNVGAGIEIDQDGAGNLIGGTIDGAANTIAFNATGILVSSGVGNSVLANSIHSNTGLGIDLVSPAMGVTPNDAGDADIGPNQLQNFPEITSAVPGDFGGVVITYFVPTDEANATYPLRIEFFKADANGQEGQIFLGFDTFTAEDFSAGPKTILLLPIAGVGLGERLTATATDSTAAGSANNTSEFSSSVVVNDGSVCSLIVTNTLDSGPGSLRDSIDCANGMANVDVDGLPGAEADVISFAIGADDPRHFYYVNDGVAGQVSRANVTVTTAGTDAGLADADPDWPHSWFSIEVASVLPEITEGVVIDGYTQAGASGNTLLVGNDAVLKIEVSGRGDLGDGPGGFFITGGDSTLRGLIVNRFTELRLFRMSGIVLSSDANRVEGNFIGTDASGTIDLGNVTHGVVVATGANNHVGGTARSARNVISGNGSAGIEIGSFDSGPTGPIGTRILNNYIGTNAYGTAALPNLGGGIGAGGGVNTVIGGDDDDDGAADGIVASRNVISGHLNSGIAVSASDTSAFDVIMLGNFVGVNAAGVAPLPNENGISLSGDFLPNGHVQIGGVTPGAGNVLSGNLGVGLFVSNAQTLEVQGNFIGTDATGTIGLGNGLGGIWAPITPFVPLDYAITIGGTEPGARNVISGNGVTPSNFGFGIRVDGQSAGFVNIQRNLIGTRIDGVTPLPNRGPGIELSGAALVGGVDPELGNVIAHNGGSGVVVNELIQQGVRGAAILGNSIFANGALGIDLGGDLLAVNDLTPTPDADEGPNRLQNFPVITEATLNGGLLTLTYSVPSAVANSTYPLRVEFFLADASGLEGRTFLGSDVYTADDFLAGSKTIVLSPLSAVAAGDEVVATATDSVPMRAGFIGPLAASVGDPNNTSEFSLSTTVQVPVPPQADLSVTKSDGAATAVPGRSLTYTIVVSNAGPAAISGAILRDVFPAAFTNVTYASTAAGGAGGNTANGSGNIVDNLSLPAGASVTYTVSGMVSASATGTLSNSASVTTPDGITDVNPNNNSATDADVLTPQADLSISKTDGVASVAAGATLTYTIVVSNAGPSAVTGATVTDLFPAIFLSPVFTATGSGGASGFSSGSGNIQQSVSLPVNGSITYVVTGTVSASASGALSNTASVSGPAGVSDPNLANGSAVDTDSVVSVAPDVGLVIGADAHSRGKPVVGVYDHQGVRIRKFLAYANSYRGGVRVALGDVTGDGVPEIVTAPGGNHAPVVKVFTLAGVELPEFRFLAYAGNFKGGVYVAVGDVAGDGLNDIVVSPAREGRGVNGLRNGGTEVRVFANRLATSPGDPFLDNAPDRKFLAFPRNVVSVNFLGGGTVATGDVQPGGKLEVIVGSGPGIRATARAFNVESGVVAVQSWLPFDRNVRGGIFVSAGKIDGDAAADVVFGAWQGSDGLVEIRSGASGALLRPLFRPYEGLPRRVGSASGLRVVARDVNGDGTVDRIIAGQGSDGRTKRVVQFGPLDATATDFLFENDPEFIGGLQLG